MRRLEFHANCIALEEADEYFLIGFADQECHTQTYVTFQCAYQFHSDDREQRMDTYHMEVRDESHSCYGGVKSIELFDRHILVQLNKHGRDLIGVETIDISFDVKKNKSRKLKESLQKMFQEIFNVVQE